MDEQIRQAYLQAGTIAAAARDLGAAMIKPGVHLLEVASKVEDHILSEGAGIAFPVNLSINDLAAHYTPVIDDDLTFSKGDLVKIDVGAHVNGYIADTARSIEVGTNNYQDLIDASRDALMGAIDLLKNGVSLSSIGKHVEANITAKGFKPIENLTGHSLDQYNLHSGLSVPNVSSMSSGTVHTDDVIAIEPFATTGIGIVTSGKGSNIYRLTGSLRSRLVRDQRARALLTKLNQRFKTLPFAQRWCKEYSNNIDASLKRLSMLGALKHYPQLLEKNKGMVSQTEHTVIIMDDGCEVIT